MGCHSSQDRGRGITALVLFLAALDMVASAVGQQKEPRGRNVGEEADFYGMC